MWIVTPVAVALFAAGKPRSAVPAGALGIPHLDVAFHSSDGLRLSGWYVPSRNGAAIVVVHGGGGSRAGAALHARLPARRGARGGAGGRARRPDVRPGTIGALGRSTGAEAVLQAAAQRHDLHAVVADGAEARNFTEAAHVAGPTDLPYWAALYLADEVLTATP